MVRKADETKVEEPMSMLEQIRDLDAKRSALIETAKATALEKANAAIEELNALGFTFSLSDGMKTTINHAPSDKPCEICGFKTEKPHDKRSHRTQDPKRPFSAEELQARNLTRI